MKTISRLIATGSSVSVLILMMAVPAGALPLSRSTADTSGTERCTKVQTLAQASDTKLSERLSAMQLDFQKRLTDISSRHDTVDQKAATFRAERNDKFETKVAELRNKEGLTDVQQTAIDQFEKDIKAAEVTRETAVDAARATYREALNQAVVGHQRMLSAAATIFQTAVKTAFTNAETNCSDSGVVATLKSSVKTARDTFQSTRKTEVAKASIKQLADTRRTAVQTADTEFKKSIATATTTLTAALDKK